MNGLIASTTNQKNGRYLRALLVLHNINQSELARNLGISQTLVNAVITGRRRGVKRKGRVVRQAVADALGMPVEELWPDAKKAA